MAREPESFERVLDWTEGEMNKLEPNAQQQWLWFGAVLLAMTIITYIATFSEVACARLLCPRRNICLVSLMEQHF